MKIEENRLTLKTMIDSTHSETGPMGKSVYVKGEGLGGVRLSADFVD